MSTTGHRATEFTLRVAQAEEVTAGQRRLDVLVRVTCAVGPDESRAAIVLVLDHSAEARRLEQVDTITRGAARAVDALPDGMAFAIATGAGTADVVYPRQGGLVIADAASRSAAKRAVEAIQPVPGAAAMSSWVSLADEVVGGTDHATKVAVLVAAAPSEAGDAEALGAALERARTRLSAHCVGVGSGFQADTLHLIADALCGSADIVRTHAELSHRLCVLARRAATACLADARLRLRTPPGVEVVEVCQVVPAITALVPRPVPRRLGVEYVTGPWQAGESRVYLVRLRIPPSGAGDRFLVARIAMASGDGPRTRETASAIAVAVRTSHPDTTAAVHPGVAHYTGQIDLARAIEEGLRARSARDDELARRHFGRAVECAAQSGHTAMLRLLERVVRTSDAFFGEVELRSSVDRFDELALAMRAPRGKPLTDAW